MALKKKKIKQSSFLYNIKTSEDKTQNIKKFKQRKVWDKPLFQEKENKGDFHQTLQNICVSDREAHFRYMITQT